MAFTRTINYSNCKLCKDYANLPLESPRLDKIEYDLEVNSHSLKELNAKSRTLQVFSNIFILAMEKKLLQKKYMSLIFDMKCMK